MFSTAWSLLRQTFTEWSEDGAPRLGAALAYYSVFSIGPLLLIAISVASLAFEAGAVEQGVMAQISKLVGEEGAKAVQSLLANASLGGGSIWGMVIGVGVLLFGAIAVVVQLKDALNIIWDVEDQAAGGLWGFLRKYALSLAAVLGLGFLLAISLFTTTMLSAMGSALGSGLPPGLMVAINFVADLAVLTLLFAMMFKWLPDTEIAWSDVWVGAALTTVLFVAGKYAISLYLGQQGLESTFGAASSIVLILVWIYYSAQIVFFGAEFTQVYARQRGSHAALATPEHRGTSGALTTSGAMTKSEAVDAHIKEHMPYLAYVAVAGTVGLAVGALLMRN